jgi:hypothetical protein
MRSHIHLFKGPLLFLGCLAATGVVHATPLCSGPASHDDCSAEEARAVDPVQAGSAEDAGLPAPTDPSPKSEPEPDSSPEPTYAYDPWELGFRNETPLDQKMMVAAAVTRHGSDQLSEELRLGLDRRPGIKVDLHASWRVGPLWPEPQRRFEGAVQSHDPVQSYDPWELGLNVEVPPASILPDPKRPRYEVDRHPEVHKQVERYLSVEGPRGLEQWLGRSGRYLKMIQSVLRDHGLPEDLFVTVLIESGFNPAAASRAGAKGLWQLMAATARRYGLRVDPWVDERLDPEKSTRAAARYLRDLYTTFGSWPLAHAAYNAGEGRLRHAIDSVRTTDFWELWRSAFLPDETKNFVVAVQAAALIFQNPALYGVSVDLEDPVRYQTIEVPPGTRLTALAFRAGVELDAIQRLNLDLQLGQTPPGEVHHLKVPGEILHPVQRALTRAPAGKAERSRHAAKPIRTPLRSKLPAIQLPGGR